MIRNYLEDKQNGTLWFFVVFDMSGKFLNNKRYFKKNK